MSVKSKPYYWLECDDCGRKSTQDTDYTAWGEISEAREEATDDTWFCSDEHDWCGGCRDKHVCRECDEISDDLKFEDETEPGYWPMCPDCREVTP